jgi:nitrite reductase/ring-hydroxylating ferredoxin subunit
MEIDMSSAGNWHPVGLSHSLEAGSSAGTRLLARELVIWRDTSGVAHVWEDRCPHRGMKLSFGFVRGDHIACLYHGWQYDRGGYCQYIPAHPDLDVPKTFKVPVYLTQERCGMVWTTLSENPADAPQDRGDALPLRSLYLDCAMDVAIAALGTVRMTPFAPQGQADTTVSRVTETLYEVSLGPDRLLIGVQAVADNRTALHLAIDGSPELYQGTGQRHFLDWALRLRHSIEHPRNTAFAPRSVNAEAI